MLEEFRREFVLDIYFWKKYLFNHELEKRCSDCELFLYSTQSKFSRYRLFFSATLFFKRNIINLYFRLNGATSRKPNNVKGSETDAENQCKNVEMLKILSLC